MKLISILVVTAHAFWEEDCYRKSEFYGEITQEQALAMPGKYPMRSDEDKLKALSDPIDFHVSAVLTCTKNARFLS